MESIFPQTFFFVFRLRRISGAFSFLLFRTEDDSHQIVESLSTSYFQCLKMFLQCSSLATMDFKDLRDDCEIGDCTCHLCIIIACRWNGHSYNTKKVSTWLEDFCSGQICRKRCKSSIKKSMLPLLPLCSVSISRDVIMQKPLQSSSYPPQLRPELWQPLALRARNIINTSKTEHWKAGPEPPLGSDPRKGLQMSC